VGGVNRGRAKRQPIEVLSIVTFVTQLNEQFYEKIKLKKAEARDGTRRQRGGRRRSRKKKPAE
jgi:hypothetical protein